MWVDTLVQIQAVHRANKEEEERNAKENAKSKIKKGQIVGNRPVINKNNTYKLQSSKWFGQDEISIVCSVCESGFIVERRNTLQSDTLHTYGIALWDQGYEKTKDSKYLNIYSVIEDSVQVFNIKKFWMLRTQIRINNSNDRIYPVNDGATIRSQLKCAEKMKFSSAEDFVCFCRYKKAEADRRPTDRNWSWRNILARIRSFFVGGN